MKSWLKIALTVLGVLLAVTLVAGMVFYSRIQDPSLLFDHTRLPTAAPATPLPGTPAPAAPAPATPTPEPTLDPEAYLSQWADEDFMNKRANILALGIDESAERADWGMYRTDTMMLVTIDFENMTVDLLSVPRDCYVKIYNAAGELANPGAPMARINRAFGMGGGAQKSGFAYACMSVSNLLDVPVNYYVCVNMPVVKDIVNAMGGVDYDMDIDFVMNGRPYTKGWQHMDGQAVLDYCRLRKDSSDLTRVERQQRMIMLILDTLKRTDQLRNVPAIYTAMQQNVMTNLSFEQISALALLAYRMDMQSMGQHTVPAKEVLIGNASCLGVDTERLERLVREVFRRKNVEIDPEIDIDRLPSTPPGEASGFVPPEGGALDYFESGDGRYYVRRPGSNEYFLMSAEEFAAILRQYPN